MTRLLYIILLIAAALFYPLYQDKLSYILLLTLIILPVLLFIQVIICAAFLRCSVKKSSTAFYKNTEGAVCFDICNNSLFPLSGCRVCVKTVFKPTGNVSRYTADVPLPAFGTETVAVNINGEHCGGVEVTLEYVKIYDLLRLFSVKCFKKNNLGGAAYIIPKISEKHYDEAMRMLSMPPLECPEETDMAVRHGECDPGDVSGFREFAPGDRLSMMHYKLSARFDSDIVKVLSVQSRNRYLLSADFSKARNDNGFDLEMRDRIFEKLMSCAFFLCESGAQVYVAVPEGAPCRYIELENGCAAEFFDRSAYFPAAKALAAADFSGMLPEAGFVYCSIES